MKKILYTKFFNEKIEEKADVILSPEFYWIKKINAPVKSLKEAKKLSKNIFDLEGEYIYDAFKLKDKFFAVAFNKNIKINIPQKYINSVRIAQIELYDYDCIKIDENHYIQKFDDLLFCFPTPKQNCRDLNEILKNLKLSNKTFNLLNRFEIDKSIIILAAIIFIFVNFSLLLNAYLNKKEIKKISAKTQNILERQNLPKTSFELNSILNTLKTAKKKQEIIKKDLEFISNLPLQKGEYVKKLSFKDNEFEITVKTKRNLDNYFKRKFQVSSSLKNGEYKARLR